MKCYFQFYKVFSFCSFIDLPFWNHWPGSPYLQQAGSGGKTPRCESWSPRPPPEPWWFNKFFLGVVAKKSKTLFPCQNIWFHMPIVSLLFTSLRKVSTSRHSACVASSCEEQFIFSRRFFSSRPSFYLLGGKHFIANNLFLRLTSQVSVLVACWSVSWGSNSELKRLWSVLITSVTAGSS